LRVLALLNAGAGALDKAATEDVHASLEQAFAKHGVTAELAIVASDALRAAAKDARKRAERGEIDAVVVGGGDGSIRTVAGVLAGTPIPLGVLPLGTLNHFAKGLGIPLRLEDAVAAIATGQPRAVDLAEVNGEVFINNSSIGIYPYLVSDRERRRADHRLAKWMAMVPAFFRMLHHFPQRRLRISAKDWTRPYRTPCLFVGNNEYATGLFSLGRRKRLDVGELWLYVVKPRTPLGLFWMICRLSVGRAEQARDIESFRLPEAAISAKASRLPVALDGEVTIMHTPLHYRSRPGALRVIVPSAR
jgi:diacylglycerol kinase family enzyme